MDHDGTVILSIIPGLVPESSLALPKAKIDAAIALYHNTLNYTDYSGALLLRTNERKTLRNSRQFLLRHGASLSPSGPHTGHLYSFYWNDMDNEWQFPTAVTPAANILLSMNPRPGCASSELLLKKKCLGFGNYFSCTLHKVIDGLHCMCPSAMPDMMDDSLNAPAYSIFRLQEEKSLLMHFCSLPVFYCPNRFGTFQNLTIIQSKLLWNQYM